MHSPETKDNFFSSLYVSIFPQVPFSREKRRIALLRRGQNARVHPVVVPVYYMHLTTGTSACNTAHYVCASIYELWLTRMCVCVCVCEHPPSPSPSSSTRPFPTRTYLILRPYTTRQSPFPIKINMTPARTNRRQQGMW